LARIISSVISLPIIFAVIYFGHNLHFLILLEIVIFIGLYELYRMFEGGGLGCYKWTGIILGLLIPISILKGSYFNTNLFVTLAIIIPFALRILEGNTSGNTSFYISNTIFGMLYVSWLASHLLMIRMTDMGRELIFFILLIAWIGDTAAYYGGMRFGKHKLAPLISPGKTIEGAIAGLIGSICGALIAKFLFLNFNLPNAILTGILVGIAGQLGDLSESLIKRNFQVKDSGSVIPGHGGMLDRIDSLLFAAPVLYYYNEFVNFLK